MDQSLYWAPRISDSTQPEDMRQIGVGGTLYSVHSARLSHNITAPEPDVLRFQVNHGDVWEDDWSRYERAEIAGPVYPADETLIVSYDLMIEPGEPSKSEWVVLSQFHADDLDTPPPFAIEFSNEQMVVRIRWRRDGEIGQIRLHRDKENLERGRYYRMHIRLRFADSEEEDGWVKVWRDGEVIADYEGPLGYGYGAYWKMGIYRTQAPETLAVNVRNLFVASEYGLIAGPDGPRIGGE